MGAAEIRLVRTGCFVLVVERVDDDRAYAVVTCRVEVLLDEDGAHNGDAWDDGEVQQGRPALTRAAEVDQPLEDAEAWGSMESVQLDRS